MRILPRVPQRLRSEGIVLAPALLVVALLVYWAAHGGGYAATTWLPSALVVLGLLVAAVAGLGSSRARLGRAGMLALGALAAYAAWSYLSIAWAPSPGVAFEGANRTLLFLLLFALFALLPWRPWTAAVTLTTFALGIGTIAAVTLVRLSGADVAELFAHGRLVSPLGYANATAALYTIGAVVAVALAARRELPLVVRPLLLALAAAAAPAAVLCASRGWLFALPVVLAVAIALVPDRARFVLWSLPVMGATAIALPALLDVFRRFDAAPDDEAARAELLVAAQHAGDVALPLCLAVLAIGLVLALVDRRVTASDRVARGANRAAAVLVAGAVLAGAAVGLAATDGRPDRTIADYWDRSQGYQSSTPGSSRFALAGSNRPDFWRVSLDALSARPIGGLGQDNWSGFYLRNRRTDEQPRWTHSLQLRLLAHTGVVGLLLFGTFACAALVAAVGGRSRAGALMSAISATALLPFAVWAVHGSVDWFWEIPALSGPAFAFLGLAAGAMASARGTAPDELPVTRARAPLRGGCAALAIVAAAALALPWVAEREIARATDVWRANPGDALDRLARARDLNPLSARPDTFAGVLALELGEPATADRRLAAALERDPDNWFPAFARGLALSELGDATAARAAFRRARALDPREPLLREALRRLGTDEPLTSAEAFGSVRQNVQLLNDRPASP